MVAEMTGARIIAILALASLSGCMGYQTGKGLNAFDTESKEEKAEEAWFKSYYGSKHCGTTEGWCDPAEKSGVGPSPWGGEDASE